MENIEYCQKKCAKKYSILRNEAKIHNAFKFASKLIFAKEWSEASFLDFCSSLN